MLRREKSLNRGHQWLLVYGRKAEWELGRMVKSDGTLHYIVKVLTLFKMPITAVEEFKRNPDLKEEDLKHIKDWLSKQPHLPHDIPDEMLILLMNSCYFSIEQSKQYIDTYFTLRTHLPEFFTNRKINNSDIQLALEAHNISLLEGRTAEGYQVLYGGFKNNDPQLFNLSTSFKMAFMVVDAYLKEDGTAPGAMLVIDFKGMKLGHLAKFSLPVAKKLVTYIQDGIPVRLKGLHFVNIVPFIDKIMMFVKPFMKKELIDMLMFHSEGSDTIYKYVPKKMFPKEFGGEGKTIEEHREDTIKLMTDYENWYTNDEKDRVDESKRPGKAKSAGDLFGLEGSFRKLDID